MRMKAFAVMLALLVPAQAWPQSALDQARMLGGGGPAPADQLYDGSHSRRDGPDGSFVRGSDSGTKTLPPATAVEKKKPELEVPNPFATPKPKDGDPRATRGAWKGGVIGGLFGALTGLVAGWGIGYAIGGALAIGLSMGIGALVLGAAAAAIGADAGRHCAVDPECG